MNYTMLQYYQGCQLRTNHNNLKYRYISNLNKIASDLVSNSPTSDIFDYNRQFLEITHSDNQPIYNANYKMNSYYANRDGFNSLVQGIEAHLQSNTYSQDSIPSTPNFKYRFPYPANLSISFQQDYRSGVEDTSLLSQAPFNFLFEFNNPQIKKLNQVDDIPVYSIYPKYLYEKFTDFYKVNSEDFSDFFTRSFNIGASRDSRWFRSLNSINTGVSYVNSYFPDLATSRTSIFSCFFAIDQTFYSLENDFCNSLEKKKVLKSKNITSTSKRTPFLIEEVTSKALHKKSLGMLIPTLFKVSSVDSQGNPSFAYIFTFIVPYSQKLTTNTSSAIHTATIFNDITSEINAYKHFDYDLYLQKLQEQTDLILGDLDSVAYLDLLRRSNLDPADLANCQISELTSTLTQQELIARTAKLNVDSTRLNKIFPKMLSYRQSILDKINSVQSLINKNCITNTEFLNTFARHLEYCSNISISIPSNINPNKLNKLTKVYTQEYSSYIERKNVAIKNQDFIPDSFIQNLSTQNIEILALEKTADGQFSKLEFAVTKPFKIIIDGKDNAKAVVAGPLKVSVKPSNQIYVSAYSKQTYYGYTNSSFKLHPHSNTSNSAANLFSGNEFSCCLGEASSMLYKAIRDCDFKMIILSVMVWLKSANSADTWGKSYTGFLSWADYEAGKLTQQQSESIKQVYTSEDVSLTLNSYASDSQEYTLELPIIQPETLPLPEITPELTTNQTYNRYTPNV